MAKVDAAVEGESAADGLSRGPVEARSLSSITAIASNPPAYPRNPTQKKLDSLELYIVRVPGSKDVFLSPLKPPTKASVSAEAINASLYYLHVATPDDDALLHECEQEREEQARQRRETIGDEDVPPEFARLNQIRRKPVPGGGGGAGGGKLDSANTAPSRPSQLENPSLPPTNTNLLQPPPLPGRPTLSARSSVDGSRENFLERVPSDDPSRPHRPLPPVPRDEPAFGAEDSQSGRKANRWSALGGYIARGQENWKEKYEALSAGRHSLDSSRQARMRPHSAHGGNPSFATGMGSPGRSSPGQSPTRRSHDARPPRPPPAERRGFHITLIRRDPTHGSQWNVATISTPRMDGSAIDIDVSTPGYNRFAGQNEPLSLSSLGANLPAALSALKADSTEPAPAGAAASDPSSTHPRRFHRKLCVSRPHQQDEPRGSIDTIGGRPSIDSLGGGGSSQSLSKLKSGYYTFNSPWNGTCTFSTSVNGRSLKCKHMIPMPGTSHPAPPNTPDNPAVTVAEIRFNTPFQAGHLHHQPGPAHLSPFTLSQTAAFNQPNTNTNHHNPPTTNPETTSPTSPTLNPNSKRASLAQFLNPNTYSTRPRSRSGASTHSATTPAAPAPTTPPTLARKPSLPSSASSADLDETHGATRLRRPPSEDRLDFRLAREPAGGGMRGKSAKLGKLVIEDEGIKMLDLVVAACMAVWWRGYYY